MSVLSATQMESFERDGFVTVGAEPRPHPPTSPRPHTPPHTPPFRSGPPPADTPLTEAELDEAEAAWDRVKGGETDKCHDHGYLDTLTHPFFEEVAKQVLRAPAVQLLETNPHERAPGTGATKWGGGHLDVQITRSGWDATPRREMLAIWLWCNGVPENRGAM